MLIKICLNLYTVHALCSVLGDHSHFIGSTVKIGQTNEFNWSPVILEFGAKFI